jgi:hypothetical protein
MRPRPAIRFGCRWWMRGRCGWSLFRLFAGSARVEGNAIWSVVVGHRWAACLIRVVAGRDLMLLDFDPTVIAIGSQPFWLRWSEGSGRPVARRHRDRAPCDADVVQPVGVAVIDSRERPAITGRCCTGQLGVAKRRGCDRKS